MNRGRIERLKLAGRIKRGKRAVLRFDNVRDPRPDRLAIEIAEPNGVRPADLVAVAGTNAAARGADVFAVGRVLVERSILGKVPGENHMGAIADPQILRIADTALGKLIELFD